MGNTKVVDLGYIDATYMSLINGSTRTISDALANTYMSDIRQRMVDAGLNDGINWSLSRIVLHIGTFDANYYRGWYLLVIKKLVAGVPTGDEWLIGYPRPAHNIFSGLGSFGTNVTQLESYFQYYNGALSSPYGYGAAPIILFHYNPNGLSSTYGIGAGVDFDPPSISPKTDLPGFMPSGVMPKGMLGIQIGITDERRVAFIFNHTATVIGYGISEFTGNPNSFVFAGKILNPKRALDTNDGGSIFLYSAANTGANAETATHVYIATLDDLDNHIVCFVRAHTLFLAGNQPYFDGTNYLFHRDAPIVANNSYIKGELKPDLFPIQGGYQRHYLRMFQSEHGRALKINDRMCIPWADDVPPLFIGWPLNPQVPTIG